MGPAVIHICTCTIQYWVLHKCIKQMKGMLWMIEILCGNSLEFEMDFEWISINIETFKLFMLIFFLSVYTVYSSSTYFCYIPVVHISIICFLQMAACKQGCTCFESLKSLYVLVLYHCIYLFFVWFSICYCFIAFLMSFSYNLLSLNFMECQSEYLHFILNRCKYCDILESFLFF